MLFSLSFDALKAIFFYHIYSTHTRRERLSLELLPDEQRLSIVVCKEDEAAEQYVYVSCLAGPLDRGIYEISHHRVIRDENFGESVTSLVRHDELTVVIYLSNSRLYLD